MSRVISKRTAAMSGALAIVAFLLLLGGLLAPSANAQDDDTLHLWEAPSTGAERPGPVGLSATALQQAGAVPVSMVIERAGVDAPVEQQRIIDGAMQDPSGPFVVAWYKETAELGQQGNGVYSGHLDYWDVGQAVFWRVGQLQEGDKIVVTGDDGIVFTYEIEWVQNFEMAEITPEQVNDIVFPGDDDELITLITCGGPFDYASGEYLERTIVRGHRVENVTS